MSQGLSHVLRPHHRETLPPPLVMRGTTQKDFRIGRITVRQGRRNHEKRIIRMAACYTYSVRIINSTFELRSPNIGESFFECDRTTCEDIDCSKASFAEVPFRGGRVGMGSDHKTHNVSRLHNIKLCPE